MFVGSARASLVGALLAVAVVLAIMLTPPIAEAKATYDSPYGFERTWNAAVRLVRVDNGWKITEKDDASGYLLFEYRSPESGPKTTPGSIELVRGSDADAPVRVVVQLTQMPRYHEQALADSLAAKMRAEYGEPPARKRAPPAPPSAPVADGGVDATP